MDSEVKQFENERVSVEATEGKGCRLSIKIFLKLPVVKKAYNKAVKTVNKQISIPGFRKGHAPNETVIARYSSYVEREWKDLIVGEAYQNAVELMQIYPINKESITKPKIDKMSQEEGALISLSFEHSPLVPQVDFSQLTLPHFEKEAVPQERVEEIVEEVRRSHADWEEVSGRSVQEGDFVDISIDSLEEDPPKSIVSDRRFEMADKRLVPWLKKVLLGLEVGSSVEAVSEVDPEAELRIKESFKPTRVQITLHAIKKMILPPLDGTLANKVGVNSLEELRSKIYRNLEREAEDHLKDKQMVALEDALLAAYQFELPSSLVAAEKQERVKRKIEAMGDSLPSDVERQQIEDEVAMTVDQALRLYYLNKQIAKQGSISLTNQELNEEISRYVRQNPQLYRKQTNEQETRDLVARMASALLQRKAKEYALEQLLQTT